MEELRQSVSAALPQVMQLTVNLLRIYYVSESPSASILMVFALTIHFWLCWVSVAVWAFPSCGEQGLLSTCGAWASHCSGFSGCRAQALGYSGSVIVVIRLSSCGAQGQQLQLLGSRAQAQQLLCLGLVALQHGGSSQTRDQTCVSCIGRQILYH